MFAQPFPTTIFFPRIQKVQELLEEHGALFISGQYDLFYLTGFETLTPDEREAFLYISKHSATLLLSSFSTNRDVEGLEKVEMYFRNPFTDQITEKMHQENINTLIMDPHTLRVSELKQIEQKISANTIDTEGNTILQTLKMVKDETEQEAITQANHITHQAIEKVKKNLRVGMTEQEVEWLLEQEFRELGATDVAFPSIIAFGDHTALPHHQPNDRTLMENDAVMIDAGAKWNHYCADVTRTFWFGDTPDAEFLNIENIVKDAYSLVIDSCKPSLQPSSPSPLFSAADIDKTARDYINGKNYGPNFIHTTGHGVGLYIHEQPSLNQRNETALKPGMVITVEPGIYLEGKFGYRFENSVIVTENGLKELL